MKERNRMDGTMGRRISELLDKNGITQRELADAVGVTEVSVSRYIHGGRLPKGPVILKMARVLGTTPEYILGQEVEEDSELAYYQTQRTIARNAKNWTQKQKADLVNALFEAI